MLEDTSEPGEVKKGFSGCHEVFPCEASLRTRLVYAGIA